MDLSLHKNYRITGIFLSRYIFANFTFLYKFTKILLRKILVGMSDLSLINSRGCGLLGVVHWAWSVRMVNIAKIFICEIYKEAILQKYNDSKISQYTVIPHKINRLYGNVILIIIILPNSIIIISLLVSVIGVFIGFFTPPPTSSHSNSSHPPTITSTTVW